MGVVTKLLAMLVGSAIDLISGVFEGLKAGLGFFIPSWRMTTVIVLSTVVSAAYARLTSGSSVDVQYYALMSFMASYAVAIWRNVWEDMFPNKDLD